MMLNRAIWLVLRKGTKFHEARGKHYSSGFGEGDTLGLLIYLPDTKNTPAVPPTLKDRVSILILSDNYGIDLFV